MKKKKWKQLDLDRLRNTKNQVVIGFKSSPADKLELLSEASSSGTNIGNYVRELIQKRTLIFESENNIIENKELKEKLKNYDSDYVKELLVNYKGKNIEYLENDGKKYSKTINSIDDIYFVIIKSFKKNPNAA